MLRHLWLLPLAVRVCSPIKEFAYGHGITGGFGSAIVHMSGALVVLVASTSHERAAGDGYARRWTGQLVTVIGKFETSRA